MGARSTKTITRAEAQRRLTNFIQNPETDNKVLEEMMEDAFGEEELANFIVVDGF